MIIMARIFTLTLLLFQLFVPQMQDENVIRQKDNIEKKRNVNYPPLFIFEGTSGVYEACIVPIEYDNQTYYICHEATSLYLLWMASDPSISREEFVEKVREHVAKDIAIPVNPEIFAKVQHDIVKIDANMYDEYIKLPSNAFFGKYKTSLNYMFKNEHSRFNFFAFLCWRNAIHITSDDESGVMVLEVY